MRGRGEEGKRRTGDKASGFSPVHLFPCSPLPAHHRVYFSRGMKLDVLQTTDTDTWYTDGLRFMCTQCGNCCTGGPGFVWISVEEVVRLARHLKLSPEEVVEKYCRKVDGKFSLRERRNARGEYDCIFLKEEAARRKEGDETVVYSKRVCTI